MSDIQTINGKLSLPQEQIEELKKPTLPQFIEDRPGPSGKPLSYVETGYIIAQLNKIFGHVWTFEVVREDMKGNQIWCLGRLRVMLTDGTILTKDQYGAAEVKTQIVRQCPRCLKFLPFRFADCRDCKLPMQEQPGIERPLSVGDDFKAAASDALKKCASLLGLAADVYHPNFYKTLQQLRAQAAKKPAPTHAEEGDVGFADHYASDVKGE